MAPSTDQLVSLVAPLTARFEAAGRRLYVVGGLVRDLVLGRDLEITDIDCTTDAVPDEVVEILRPWADALWTQGARFGTVGATREGRTYEITTHRSEVYVADSRKPHVTYSTRIHDDLARRDFTVNAMAVDLVTGEVIDPFDGRGDLDRSVLRTPLDPDVSFSEDPLRMMRAARFHAGYDLAPTPELVDSVERLRDRMRIVAIERVRDELDKLLAVPRPHGGLELMARTGLGAVVLGGAMASDPAGVRTALPAIDRAERVGTRRLAVLAHLVEPARPLDLAVRLKASNRTRTEVVRLGGAIDDLATPGEWTPERVRRFVRRRCPELGDQLDDVVDVARARWHADPHRAAAVEQAVAAVVSLADVEDLTDLDPPLSGDDVRRILRLAEGPEVGAALEALGEHRFRHGPLDRAAAESILRAWAASRDHTGAGGS